MYLRMVVQLRMLRFFIPGAKQYNNSFSTATQVKGQENVTTVGLAFEEKGRRGIPWNLPDWSYAGYGAGEKTPWESPRMFNVLNYGASRSGKKDASAAIQKAIDAAAYAGSGTVYLPAGRYLLNKPLRITRSKIVLKGAGWDKTILTVPKPLSSVMKKAKSKSRNKLIVPHFFYFSFPRPSPL